MAYHTQIPNKLLDSMIQCQLTARQYRVVLLLVRQTFGIGEKGSQRRNISVTINLYKISGSTGIPISHIKDVLNKLVETKIILWNRPSEKIMLNCRPETWIIPKSMGFKAKLYNQALSENIKEFQNRPGTNSVPKSATEIVPSQVTSLLPNPDTTVETNSRVLKEIPKQKEINNKGDYQYISKDSKQEGHLIRRNPCNRTGPVSIGNVLKLEFGDYEPSFVRDDDK
jgi:phage replication O-like protein O